MASESESMMKLLMDLPPLLTDNQAMGVDQSNVSDLPTGSLDEVTGTSDDIILQQLLPLFDAPPKQNSSANSKSQKGANTRPPKLMGKSKQGIIKTTTLAPVKQSAHPQTVGSQNVITLPLYKTVPSQGASELYVSILNPIKEQAIPSATSTAATEQTWTKVQNAQNTATWSLQDLASAGISTATRPHVKQSATSVQMSQKADISAGKINRKENAPMSVLVVTTQSEKAGTRLRHEPSVLSQTKAARTYQTGSRSAKAANSVPVMSNPGTMTLPSIEGIFASVKNKLSETRSLITNTAANNASAKSGVPAVLGPVGGKKRLKAVGLAYQQNSGGGGGGGQNAPIIPLTQTALPLDNQPIHLIPVQLQQGPAAAPQTCQPSAQEPASSKSSASNNTTTCSTQQGVTFTMMNEAAMNKRTLEVTETEYGCVLSKRPKTSEKVETEVTPVETIPCVRLEEKGMVLYTNSIVGLEQSPCVLFDNSSVEVAATCTIETEVSPGEEPSSKQPVENFDNPSVEYSVVSAQHFTTRAYREELELMHDKITEREMLRKEKRKRSLTMQKQGISWLYEGMCDGNDNDNTQPKLDDKEIFENHNATSVRYRYGCYLCDFQSSVIKFVTKHWLQCHIDEKPYTCPCCRVAFDSIHKVNIHLKRFHPKEKTRAVLFKNSNMYNEQLLLHFTELGSNEKVVSSFGCSDNGNRVITDAHGRSVPLPRKIVTPLKPHKGDIWLPSKEDELKDPPLTCTSCGYRTLDALDLREHLKRAHTRSAPFHCNICVKSYTNTFDLTLHRLQEHFDLSHGAGVPFDRAYTKVMVPAIYYPQRQVTRYLCHKCVHDSSSEKEILGHAIAKHNWPPYVICGKCRKTNVVKAGSVQMQFLKCKGCGYFTPLGPLARVMLTISPDEKVYVCRVCDYKSTDKSGITRHVKYNYISFKPYCCPYCDYATVEKPKVRKHIVSNHPDVKVAVGVRVDMVNKTRDMLELAYRKCVMEVTYTDLELLVGEEGPSITAAAFDWSKYFFDVDSMDVTPTDIPAEIKVEASDGEEVSGAAGKQLTLLDGTSKEQGLIKQECESPDRAANLRVKAGHKPTSQYFCKDCRFTSKYWQTYEYHRHVEHGDGLFNMRADAMRRRGTNRFNGAYFKCKVCDFLSWDCSGMTRHIKYMHMKGRAHSCMYCNYSNVEKTKVRQHVLRNHPTSDPLVKTNLDVLRALSSSVSHFYEKIQQTSKTKKGWYSLDF